MSKEAGKGCKKKKKKKKKKKFKLHKVSVTYPERDGFVSQLLNNSCEIHCGQNTKESEKKKIMT